VHVMHELLAVKPAPVTLVSGIPCPNYGLPSEAFLLSTTKGGVLVNQGKT
jgi:hypothetical protein